MLNPATAPLTQISPLEVIVAALLLMATTLLVLLSYPDTLAALGEARSVLETGLAALGRPSWVY